MCNYYCVHRVVLLSLKPPILLSYPHIFVSVCENLRKDSFLSSKLLTKATAVFDFLYKASVCQTTPDGYAKISETWPGPLSTFAREPQHYLRRASAYVFYLFSSFFFVAHLFTFFRLLQFTHHCQPFTSKQTPKVAPLLLVFGISPSFYNLAQTVCILRTCLRRDYDMSVWEPRDF